MSALRQIASVSLREQVIAAVRAAMVLGEIEPGRVYSAPSLARSLGVSATPVREAMLELVEEGLVEAVRNKGFRIVELTDSDLDEILELRLLLEVPSVGQVAGSLDAAATAELEAQLLEMEESSQAGDLTRYLQADRRFHLTLLEQLDNGRLVAIVDRLREHSRLYGFTQLSRAGRLDETTAEHRAIFEAVESGDRDAAERLMQVHLSHTRGAWARKDILRPSAI
jgi:DNA-binding GntR family transcriptional regulator